VSLQNRIKQLRDSSLPNQLQGVTKARIRAVLEAIDRESNDIVDAVFALLDDITPSLFTSARPGTRFCDGASTQHIAAHVGTLQREGTRLDREGRDYWIKPLRELGAIEPVYLQPETGAFILGHPIAKSPNSAYRLAKDFQDILAASEAEWEQRLKEWIQEDRIRRRLELQAQMAELAKHAVDTKHSDLIQACQKVYSTIFLSGYNVIYVDDGDGDRITEEQRQSLAQAGIEFTLSDAMPDVLLWNPIDDKLWVIEAVTSDGEVDIHKLRQLTALATRAGKAEINFTTAYQTWKAAATRQTKYKNLPPGTYLWIMEDPTKHFLAIEPSDNQKVNDPSKNSD
jgi:hypothetical protein